jgi:hypothetical protein
MRSDSQTATPSPRGASVEEVRAALEDMEARLAVLRREERLDFLTTLPEFGRTRLSAWSSYAFMALAPLGLFASALAAWRFALALGALALASGLLASALVIPAVLSTRRLLRQGKVLPCAVVAAGEAAREGRPVWCLVQAVIGFGDELRLHPERLVDQAGRIRSALASGIPAGGEEGDFLRWLERRVREGSRPTARRRLPASWSGGHEAWLVELLLLPELLPGGRLWSGLLFCLAHEGERGLVLLLQSDPLWGERGLALSAEHAEPGEAWGGEGPS